MTARPTMASSQELWRLAWPFILSQSCWTFQIVLDRVLLSQSSVEAVGAGISAVMMFWSALTLFQYTALYATTFVAQYTGAGQPLRVGAVVGQALWFAVGSGLLFLLLAPLAGWVTSHAGHAPELHRMEAAYFRCLCFCALPLLVNAAVTSFFGGRGDSTTVMLINVAGLLVNAFWAVTLIFGKLGFPQMGIEGAGWATVFGCSTTAALGLLVLFRKRHTQEYGLIEGLRPDRELFGRLMHYGLPQGIGACLETLAFSVFLIFVGRLGTEDLAATSIACTLNLLAFLPMMGVGQAIEVLVGQYLGADQPEDAERAAWTGLVLAFSVTLFVAAAYAFFPQALARPFQTAGDPEGWARVVERVPPLLRFVAAYCLFDCLNIAFSFALRGAGDTRFVTGLAIAISWPVMVLPTYLSWKYGWGLYVAWAFATAYVILLALTLFVRFLHGAWKQMRVIEAGSEGLVVPRGEARETAIASSPEGAGRG
ncbi:MAG: MATE family efflux transporter [Gemmataceae bacterium]